MIAKPGQKNQTDKEFFAVVETGRKGLEQVLNAKQDEIFSVAAVPVKKRGQQWLARALTHITTDETLRDVLRDRRGLYSVYCALIRAAQIGIQIGGQFPHAYLVPYNNQVQLQLSAQGYLYIAKHGPCPVIKDAQWGIVREGDFVEIDQAAGSVQHKINPLKERGKIIGVWVRIEPLDGAPVISWMSYFDIIKVRDSKSRMYKAKPNASAWATDEEAMCIKTALKRALKPFTAEAEGLAMAYAEEEELNNDESVDGEEIQQKPVSERISARLDSMLVDDEQEKAKTEENSNNSQKIKTVHPPGAGNLSVRTPSETKSERTEGALDLF